MHKVNISENLQFRKKILTETKNYKEQDDKCFSVHPWSSLHSILVEQKSYGLVPTSAILLLLLISNKFGTDFIQEIFTGYECYAVRLITTVYFIDSHDDIPDIPH